MTYIVKTKNKSKKKKKEMMKTSETLISLTKDLSVQKELDKKKHQWVMKKIKKLKVKHVQSVTKIKKKLKKQSLDL